MATPIFPILLTNFFKPAGRLPAVIILFCCISLPAMAQHNVVDSLTKILRTTPVKEDTNRVKALGMLSSEFIYDNPDTAIVMATQALELAKKLQWEKGIGDCYSFLGDQYWSTGNYSRAIEFHNKALEIQQHLGDKPGMCSTYADLGNVYFKQSAYDKALSYYFKAQKIAEECNRKRAIASGLSNIGNVYTKQGNFSRALDYYQKGIKIAEELGDKRGIANKLGNIAGVYDTQGNYTLALLNFQKALHLFEELGDKTGVARTLSNIGGTYANQGDSAVASGNEKYAFSEKYPKALDSYKKTLKIAEEQGDQYSVAFRLNNIGALDIALKKYGEAEDYLLRALQIASEIDALELQQTSEYYLSELYTKTGNYKLALENYKKSIAARDTIYSEESKKNSMRTEMNFEFEKKEAVEKEARAAATAIAAAESRKQKIILRSVGAVLLLVILFAGFIFRSLRITRRQKQTIEIQKSEVEVQKEIIESRNKDITDSINYAQRIQQAKLPRKEDIYASFPGSFILFMPKDIVSGDFYFFHKSDPVTFIAAADCTGHGVPGALMSMIGSELLNDAVSQHSGTSEILKQVNKRIKASLRQSDTEGSSRDGMDIALCAMDMEKRVVNYAGANRPFWVIRNGKEEVEEIKATKKAIGGLTEDEQHFDSHQVQLNPGDTFYICTDGYADMFNGSGTKKLTTRKFREMLLSIRDKSMPDQEKYLADFAKKWQGDTEQVDDILVIGIRV